MSARPAWGADSRLRVTGVLDDRPPVVTDVTLTPTTVDVREQDATVTVELHATDDLAGASGGQLRRVTGGLGGSRGGTDVSTIYRDCTQPARPHLGSKTTVALRPCGRKARSWVCATAPQAPCGSRPETYPNGMFVSTHGVERSTRRPDDA